ncbi:MAG: hypothetical protein M3Z08_04835 [Chloroflexota bacterium]|nr:hypothetical protein [Chloroflexota bacterium]
MQQRHQTQEHERLFTASEVAEFEYCPLVWWHEQYEQYAQANNEELFARMVELEHDHGPQAPALPEYQMLERLLLRRGAFEEGRELHLEHAQEVEEAQEEGHGVAISGHMRQLTVAVIVLLVIAIVLIAAAVLLR